MRVREKRRMLRPSEARPDWEPSRTHDAAGYVVLSWRTGPKEYVSIREHRLVADAVEGTHVHHIDGNRANNDPSNLMLLGPHEHAQLHGDKRRRLDRAQAAALYRLGLSTNRIADLLGFDKATVWRGLKSIGVVTRTKAEAQQNWQRYVQLSLEPLPSTMTFADLLRRLGVQMEEKK